MKKVFCLIIFVLMLITGFIFAGCEGRQLTSDSNSSNLTPPVFEVQEPIWDRSQLEVEKELARTPKAAYYVYNNEIEARIPFYRGSMPLKFKSYNKLIGSSGEMLILGYGFRDFTNHFVYLDPRLKYSGIAEGAVTLDEKDRLLAEARLSDLLVDENKMLRGILLEEFHYGPDGNLKFRCVSEIEASSGFKLRETDKWGKKGKEYYFIWPTSGF